MQHRRGTSLCEVLLALVLLSATAAWGLQAAAAAERAVGSALAHRAALHRAERALADLDALPCDSVTVARTTGERRWQLTARRNQDGPAQSDDIELHDLRGDTVRVHRARWCE
jgi:Tfp pilus assembly protein PilV